MLLRYLYYLDEICNGVLVIFLFVSICVVYAYIVNLYRKPDDPKKRDYDPMAILIWPLSLAICIPIWTAAIIVFTLRFILYALWFGCFLIIFTFALITQRKPILLTWLEKLFTKIGDPLLEIGTYLVRTASGAWPSGPQPT